VVNKADCEHLEHEKNGRLGEKKGLAVTEGTERTEEEGRGGY